MHLSGVCSMQCLTHMLRRPRKGTGILGFLAGSPGVLPRHRRCVVVVCLVGLGTVN
jgi:hypothetical protein